MQTQEHLTDVPRPHTEDFLTCSLDAGQKGKVKGTSDLGGFLQSPASICVLPEQPALGVA